MLKISESSRKDVNAIRTEKGTVSLKTLRKIQIIFLKNTLVGLALRCSRAMSWAFMQR